MIEHIITDKLVSYCDRCGKEIKRGFPIMEVDGLGHAYNVTAWRMGEKLEFCNKCQANLRHVVWMWHRSYPPYDYDLGENND